MSETIQNLGKARKTNKRKEEKAYNEFINDDFTFSLDEVLGILGPRKETI